VSAREEAQRVFVDTSAWYALNASDDESHDEARDKMRALLAEKTALYTSSLVMQETYTLLRMRRGYSAAFRFVEAAAASPRLEVIRFREVDEEGSYDLLRRFADHHFSFVDAASFVTMKERRIRHAFAFDDDFAVAGFSLV